MVVLVAHRLAVEDVQVCVWRCIYTAGIIYIYELVYAYTRYGYGTTRIRARVQHPTVLLAEPRYSIDGSMKAVRSSPVSLQACSCSRNSMEHNVNRHKITQHAWRTSMHLGTVHTPADVISIELELVPCDAVHRTPALPVATHTCHEKNRAARSAAVTYVYEMR